MKDRKELIFTIVLIVILLGILFAVLFGVIFNKDEDINKSNKTDEVNNKPVFSFLNNVKKEIVTADTFEDISNRIEAELKNEDELYYFSYSVLYYITKDGLASAFTNPYDEGAMYVRIYGKTVGQLIDEGKELMKENDMTIEKFKETLKNANEQTGSEM